MPYCGDVKIFIVRGGMNVDEEKKASEGIISPIYTLKPVFECVAMSEI